jgi:nicotinamidase-related amidase
MIEIEGRSIPTTINELIEKRHTALIVIDLQNDFCSKGGVYDHRGRDLSMCIQVAKATAMVMEVARKAGILIIYIQNTTLGNLKSDSATWLRFRMKMSGKLDYSENPLTLEGSWGQEFVEEVKPSSDDVVVKKYRSSAFVGTELDLILRSNGIRTLVVTGVMTEGCVESTVRDATFYDYFVVLLKDCVGSPNPMFHEASLRYLAERCDLITSDEVMKVWA